VVGRLGASKWEVLMASEDLSVYPETPTEKAKMGKRSDARVARLSPQLRDEVTSFQLAPKPWERIIMHKSLPELRASLSDGPADVRQSRRQPTKRSSSFGAKHRNRLSSVADLLSAPVTPEMPVSPDDSPEYYTSCMRLLLLASAMNSFDVVVLMAATDEENLRLFSLLGDMRQMLQYVTRRKNEIEGRPQVMVPLLNDTMRMAEIEQICALKQIDSPFVIPRRAALPSLVCEVLHPDAHWSGALERKAAEESELERRDREAGSLEEGSPSPLQIRAGSGSVLFTRGSPPTGIIRSPSGESNTSLDDPIPQLFGAFRRRMSPAGVAPPSAKPSLNKRPSR